MKQSFTSRETSSRGQALAILAVLLFCIPLVASGLKRATFDGRPTAVRDAETATNPEYDLVVAWHGGRLGDPRIADVRRKLLGEVAADGLLRGGSPYVADVTSADDQLAALTASDMTVEQAKESLSGIWLGRGGLKIKATNNGRRDLEWTARRIETELNAVEGRTVVVSLRPMTTPVSGDTDSPIEIPEFDLEVFCAAGNDPLATPATLRDEVLKVRGYPTAAEPDGQQLVAEAFEAVGTPVAIRIRLTDAGKAVPAAARDAIRHAAADAGIASEDLMVSGSLLTAAERAETLSAAASPGAGGGLWNGVLSPIVITLAAAGVLGMLVGGYSIDLICSMVLGAFGAAGLAAGMNALGIAWTESLLLIPAVVFVLTVATTLLEPAAGGSLSARVRRPMSASTLLSALCLVTLLVGSNMQRTTDRQFALAGAAACAIAWGLSTICVPPVASLLGGRPIRRVTHGLDFAEWIVTHQRITATVAATVGVALAVLLLQPDVQNWVSAPRGESSRGSQFALERSLGGTSDIRAEIHFDAERMQRMRILERAGIVRATVQKLKSCHGVTGAMSLAEAAPDIPRPADDARTRERSTYIARSNKVAEHLRDRNEVLGGAWLLEHGSEDGSEAVGETWVIRASLAELAVDAPQVVVADLNRAIQDVLRFHAGVSHEITGDVVKASLRSATPSRRPGVIGVLVALSLIVAAVGTGSLGRGLAVAGIVAIPGVAVLIAPGFQPGQFGAPAFLAIAIPLSLGVMSCVRLVNDLGEWVAATSTRHEALAFAFTGSMTRSRQALVTLAAVLGGLSLLTPQLVPSAVRAGVWVSVWAMAASQCIFPLLLSGRLGRLIVRDGERGLDTVDDHVVAAPIRLEPVIEAPHFELETTRRRVRSAG
ncbi:hypothetical protein Pan44_30840 [Caulifigura coniformis]|uniref:MMPL family protein n=1 Tax=Caulifigura coniformis TaxID=2527983 RepID=A0A517SFY9_9PLAN|nr:hypothetical protein [Caulifigura coniformis]QDT55043.1 hypothetical protein Pan44_30840 [Caulifigura coniformis]